VVTKSGRSVKAMTIAQFWIKPSITGIGRKFFIWYRMWQRSLNGDEACFLLWKNPPPPSPHLS
jgi:hypothetical protein